MSGEWRELTIVSNKHGMNWIRKPKRLAIYLRDGMACVYCGAGIEDGATLTLDHVRTRSNGGGNEAGNLVTCCRKCNTARGDRGVGKFCLDVAGYLNHGVKGDDILKGVANQLSQPLDLNQAKRIIGNRPTWQQALELASMEIKL